MTGGLPVKKTGILVVKELAIIWGLQMRVNNAVKLVCPGSALSRADANVYDFGERQTESGRRRRIKALERENVLLTRMVSEIGNDIVHLRKFLARA